MPLTDDDYRKIAQHIAAELKIERHAWWVEPETHAEQHQFLKRWMEREEKRERFWNKVKQTVTGWIVISVIGGLVVMIGMGVTQWIGHLIDMARKGTG